MRGKDKWVNRRPLSLSVTHFESPSTSLTINLSCYLSISLSCSLSPCLSLSLSLSHSASFFFPFFLCSRWCEGERAVRRCAELWRTCCLRGCQFREVRTFFPNNRSGVLEFLFLTTDVLWFVNEIYLYLFLFIYLFLFVCLLIYHHIWLDYASILLLFISINIFIYSYLFIYVHTS